jgi:hypothetical protein
VANSARPTHNCRDDRNLIFQIALALRIYSRTLYCFTKIGNTITHVYEARARRDKRGFDLISDALPFGRAVVWRDGSDQQRNQSEKTC